MGAFLAVLAEVFELSSVTGISVEAFLSGEAFSTAELLQSHITNLVLYGGLTEAEALAATEVSAEAFSALTSLEATFPQAFTALATTELATTGTLTVGAAIAAALYPYYYDLAVPVANLDRTMALQIYTPDWDVDFPGIRPLARFLNYIDPYTWASDLYHSIGRHFWERVQRYGQNVIQQQLEQRGRALAVTSVQSLSELIAQYFENARWAITSGPQTFYNSLSTYYSQLPGVNPAQARDLYRRLGENIPGRFGITADAVADQQSAEYVHREGPPGGAEQRTTPDWMLPLILGLYGELTPSWSHTLKELEEEEDGPQKKKRRRAY
nr:minor capsid protein VP2 [Rhinolophus affinis polyomavirus 4]